MSEHEYALGDMDRRLGNLLRIGTVTQVDTANAVMKVDIGDLVTDWVPWSTPRAGQDQVWTTPDVGEQVLLLSPGDPSQGVVIGSMFQNAHPANGNDGKDRRITFADGSLIEFDRTGSVLNVVVQPAGHIRLHIGNTTLLLENGKTTLTTPELLVSCPQSTFTGAVTVQGLLTYTAGLTGSGGSGASMTGPITQSGGAVTLAGASLTHNGKNVGSTHTHTGVQTGGGTTGAPS